MSLRRSLASPQAWLLAMVVCVTTSDAFAEPVPSPGDAKREDAKPEDAKPESIEHGSGKGDGDSRGPGAGDGRGRYGTGVDHGTRQGAGDAEGGGVGDGRGARHASPLPDASAKASNKTVEKPSPLAMQLNDDFRVTPSVSYQMRYYHLEGRDFVPGGVTNALRHRARLGLEVRYASLADVFIQLQDVRTLGEESDPARDFAADGFDLHQGYLSFMPGEHTRLRLGRQEVALANERLVGRPLFTEHSRSFDGFHFRYDKQVELEAGYFLVRDYGLDTVEDGPNNGKRHLGIGHLGYQLFEAFHPRVLSVLDVDTATDRVVITAGGIVTGHFGDDLSLDYSAEGYYQGGKDGDLNVSAWLAAASTRVTTGHFGHPYAEVHAVLASGDDEPEDPTINTFNSPYPRGHRIHGEMDFFINFIRDTDARGLRDLGGKLGWAPEKVALSAEFHFFDAMASRADGLRQFGFESDFKIAYPFWDYASIDTLYGLFVPGEIKRVGLVDPGVEHFVYATAKLGF